MTFSNEFIDQRRSFRDQMGEHAARLLKCRTQGHQLGPAMFISTNDQAIPGLDVQLSSERAWEHYPTIFFHF